jgi:uncharacterized Zn finger protein (UPF0148 family)
MCSKEAELRDFKVPKIMSFRCKTCNTPFRKDLTTFTVEDEVCPSCGEQLFVDAEEPVSAVEARAAAVQSELEAKRRRDPKEIAKLKAKLLAKQKALAQNPNFKGKKPDGR